MNDCSEGELVTGVDFDILEGQLVLGETIIVGGDAGDALVALDALHSVLPNEGASFDPCSAGNCLVTFDVDSGVTWKIRLDRHQDPSPRAQFYMRWLNAAGFGHHLRIGWVVSAYERDGKAVMIEPSAMAVLVYLARHANQVIAAEELTKKLWRKKVVGDDAVYQRIHRLRAVLEDDPHHAKYIETIPKKGYRLIAPVSGLVQDKPDVDQDGPAAASVGRMATVLFVAGPGSAGHVDTRSQSCVAT